MRILVVQHDSQLAAVIAACLNGIGFDVEVAADLSDADLKLRGTECHGLVADRAQPDGDVLRLVADHRRAGWTRPVLMLTALDSHAERAALIEQGADDYLVKPFSTAELAARMRSLCRAPVVPAQESRPRFGTLEWSRHDDVFTRAGVPLPLAVPEAAVLRALVLAGGALVTRERLAEYCAAEGDQSETRPVDVLIGRLRRRLGPPDPIQTVRRIGYRLVDPA
ncbi:response regulator transcription factor [Streptomyces sp. JV185]|uniref:response regulator transcription factor n=1 Tax=Streptomyces sp. JV185 TaxID=858638 RepID=UPI002E76E031|nr:response regulator transcription factor [Streptomyces sp. JV185]MEE1769423.1 response regulator transcription factor [Streptomyces sp. JV185]